MNAAIKCNEKSKVPDALRVDHEEIRAVLAGLTAEPGAIGSAARHLARLCLPHFEQEEKIVFPVFGLLRDLATGDVRADMADLLPLIAEFHTSQAGKAHEEIGAATEALRKAACAEECARVVEFTERMLVHERVEDEMIYPAVILVGKYLRLSLGQRARARPSAHGHAGQSMHAAGRTCGAYRRNGRNA